MRSKFETEAEYQDRLQRIAARDGTSVEQAEKMLLIMELTKHPKSKRKSVAASFGYVASGSTYVKAN